MITKGGETLWFHDEGTVLEASLLQGFMVNITARKKDGRTQERIDLCGCPRVEIPLTSILGSLTYLAANSEDLRSPSGSWWIWQKGIHKGCSG